MKEDNEVSMSKIIPDHVDFRLRIPLDVDRALRRRAADRWMDRNTYVRELSPTVRDYHAYSRPS
jgi:hypothetical protein